jgi:hypothetical protein
MNMSENAKRRPYSILLIITEGFRKSINGFIIKKIGFILYMDKLSFVDSAKKCLNFFIDWFYFRIFEI